MAETKTIQGYVDDLARDGFRNLDLSNVVKNMRKNNHLANTSALNAFGLGMLAHGGGFFYLRKFLLGTLCLIAGYVIAIWLLKTCVYSLLSYVSGSFDRDWTLAKWLLAADILFHFIASVIAAIITPHVRIKAIMWLDFWSRRVSAENVVDRVETPGQITRD